jgi:hypothetical protein
MYLPSGENAIEFTLALWPYKTFLIAGQSEALPY